MIFIDSGLLRSLYCKISYLLKSTEVIQICEFDNLHMTQCAKIIVGFMANVGNVFYPTLTNVFFIFSTFFYVFLTFFLIFISTFSTSMAAAVHAPDKEFHVEPLNVQRLANYLEPF